MKHHRHQSAVPNDDIVQAAVEALQPYAPTSPEQAANMLLFWVRRSEMTDADLAEIQARMFPRDSRIDVDTDFRDGYVEGFLDALAVMAQLAVEAEAARLAEAELAASDR